MNQPQAGNQPEPTQQTSAEGEWLRWVDLPTPYCLLYVPFPSVESAEHAGQTLVEERLAACTNLLQGGHSFFWWEGKVQKEPEVILIVKTSRKKVAAAVQRLQALHPYTVPAILELPILSMPASYAQWLEEQLEEKQ